jgi:hypothetical protein
MKYTLAGGYINTKHIGKQPYPLAYRQPLHISQPL